jgi:polyphenol oxidase
MNTSEVEVDGRPLPLLRSSVLPAAQFSHAFPTRAGGVSDPPFDTFNMGGRMGDHGPSVAENRRRLLAAVGGDQLYLVRQVHGPAVAVVGAGDGPEGVAGREADAVITDVPGAAIGVFVADCVPLLLADPVSGACAAVHAGWRGVVAGVVPATVRALAAAYGSGPVGLRVALGPAIGACCFEVGPEVVEAFAAALPGAGAMFVREHVGARPHIDLKAALRLQLQALGVPPEQIDAGPECTRCDGAARFYSYRRDNGRTGQHLAVIVRRRRR